ncbi:MAG: DUF1573 domain-containing protein [Verrucomicrobiota bacterium]
MPYVLLLLIAALCLHPSSAPGQVTNAEHAPKLVCDEPTYNFGEADNSGSVEHTFILKNEGDVTLEILNIRPACGCTVANISTKSIPPDGAAELSTRLSLQGRTGPQHKSITVESNDPKQQYVTLYLEGNAIAELEVKPRQVTFGRISAAAAVTSAVEITARTTNAIRITRLDTPSTNLAAKLETIEEGRRYRILVSSVPPLAQGTLRGSVHIETDHPKYSAMDIPISAFVATDLMYLPTELTLVENPAASARYIIVRSDTGKKFEVQAVVVPSPSIQASVQPIDQNGYRIELTNIVATADLNGKALLIKTTMPGNEEIRIPLRVIPNAPQPAPAQNP